MKKVLSVIIASAIVMFIIPGCSKKKGCTDPLSIQYNDDAEEDDGSCQYGGLGGSTTIVAKPQHHGVAIVGSDSIPDSAFVKFNAINQPGTNASDYDLIVVGEDGEDHVHLEGLKPGKYFIYMTGYDPAISERVAGGIPYTLTAASGEVEQVIPVTE